jgi:hypothetical protein
MQPVLAPTATGRIEFSARLLDNSTSSHSGQRTCFGIENRALNEKLDSTLDIASSEEGEDDGEDAKTKTTKKRIWSNPCIAVPARNT